MKNTSAITNSKANARNRGNNQTKCATFDALVCVHCIKIQGQCRA